MSHDHNHLALQEDDIQPSSIDTKSKLILTLIYVVIATLIVSYEQLLFLLVFTIILIGIYHASIKAILVKALLPFPLIVSLTLLSYFTDVGDNMVNLGEATIAYSNLEYSLFLFARSMIIVIGAISLVESEPSFFEIIYAMAELKFPKTLVSLLLLMYRSALDLFVEAKRMLDVRYSRSTYKRWGTNLYSFRIIGYMVGNIMVRAFIKKDLRRDALYSRNFKGTLYHKSKPFRFNGLLLLWLGTISLMVILLSANVRFLEIGTRIR